MNAQHGSAPDRWQRTDARGQQQQRPQHTARPGRPYSGRRRPPYGAQLAAILADPSSWPGRPGTSADGSAVTAWVLTGPDAWTVAEQWANPREAMPPLFVVAPPGEDPSGFDWSLLAGHPPVLIWPCGELQQPEVAALVAALVRDGIGRVLVLADSMRFYLGGRHA